MKKALFLLVIIFASTLSYSQKQETFSGKYKSIMGVMNSLSCYCYNGGYLTYDTDKKIKVSFDEMNIEKVKTGNITIFGHFDEVTHTTTPNDPCSGGTITLFIVESYKPEVTKELFSFKTEWQEVWRTNYGKLDIEVSGNKLTGSYPKGTIEGTLQKTETGSEIKGTWQQKDKAGWFSFSKHNEENKFYGEWGYSEDKETVAGEWNGVKGIFPE